MESAVLDINQDYAGDAAKSESGTLNAKAIIVTALLVLVARSKAALARRNRPRALPGAYPTSIVVEVHQVVGGVHQELHVMKTGRLPLINLVTARVEPGPYAPPTSGQPPPLGG